MDIEVTEVVPGELDVTVDGTARCRIVIPAGVGVPGVDDDEFAAALVAELVDRGAPLPDVIDVTALLRDDPALLAAVADRAGAP